MEVIMEIIIRIVEGGVVVMVDMEGMMIEEEGVEEEGAEVEGV